MDGNRLCMCKKSFQFRGDIIFCFEKEYDIVSVRITYLMLGVLLDLDKFMDEYFYTERESRKLKLDRLNGL